MSTEFDFDNAVIVDEPAEDAPPERTRKPRSDKGKPRGPRSGGRPSRAAASRKLADDLLEPWAALAIPLSFTAPTAAGVMLSRGEKTVDAIVRIAEKHPRILKALQKSTEMAAWVELAQTGIQMALAFGMDMGRIPPDAPMAALTGVAEIYAQTHPPMSEQNGHDPHRPPYPPNMVPFPGMEMPAP